MTAAALTVMADAQTRVYGAANPTLTYTSSGLVNGDTLTGLLTTSAATTSNVGLYGVTQGTLASSANYTLAYTPANLAVRARPISVTADAKGRTYGNANPTFTYTVGGAGLVNGDLLTGVLATSGNLVSGVGSYAITQGTLTASANYDLTGYYGGAMTIAGRPITVAAVSATVLVGAPDPALAYTVRSGSLVNGDVFSGALATTAGGGAGAYPILIGTLSAGANYLLSYIGGTLTYTTSGPVVKAPAAVFPSHFISNAIVIPVQSAGAAKVGDSLTAVLSATPGAAVCAPGTVSATVNRYNRIDLTGGNSASCKTR